MPNPNLPASATDNPTSAHPDVVPEAHDTHRSTRRELLLKRMALVGTIGTVALSAIATEMHGNIQGFYEAAKTAFLGASDPNVQSHLNIDPRLSSVTIFGQRLPYPDVKVSLDTRTAHEGQPKTEIIEPDAHLAMPWALEFSSDPAARDVTEARQDVQPLIGSIKHYEREGYTIDAVEIQGFASDEVDKLGAGLDEHNPANVELANTRAKAVKGVVVAPELKAQGYDLPIKILPGQEVIDPAVNHEVEKLAVERGMDVDSYIKAFNNHYIEFSKHELEALNHYVDDRYVKVLLKMHREVPQITKEHHGGDFILVPFLIPLWRKRKVESETAPKPRIPKILNRQPRPQNLRVPKIDIVSSHTQIRKQPRPHNYHRSRSVGHPNRPRQLLHTGR